ncbi:TetR family transcriptional regulator [Acinetobacter sp. ANC 4558]|uniref:TetR/AcrR family transcriptional regulator n=1 Tax=Acinetobacter sp. ANC 4558 TaxID=1977876 RepID=UPI000A357669|nr:TetR/AcrR family transcriptional regulator [Acinetobacter sp. ANC 4558]OTG86684.1 TetR family transcriptional regulator [Acinetobacter sp. ANC 4558]
MSKSALKILNTAEKLFNQYSFTSVGVDLIRDESGCSKTTLYTYYKNKDHLMNAVLIARDQYFQTCLLAYVGEAHGKDALHKILDWHVRWFKEDTFKGCLFIRAVAETTHRDHEIREIAQQHKQWIKQLIYQYCPMENQNLVSELLYTLIEGLISRFLVDGFDEQVAEQIRKFIDNCDMTSFKS